jgi:error-prone DNA polymerase
MVTGADAPTLPGMHKVEEMAADLWATGLSAARHPTELVRGQLAARGIVTAAQLRELPDRTVVDVAGVVTHRQQPSTSKGVIFLNLEDETGLVNVICTPDVWKRYRAVARTVPALEIRGLLEKYQGVVNVLARRIVALPLGLTDLLKSRDFH